MPASSDMTEYSSGAVGLAVKALKLAQAAEKQALDNLRLLETGGGNVLDTDRQKALGLLQSQVNAIGPCIHDCDQTSPQWSSQFSSHLLTGQLQRRKVQVATAEAAVKAWIRCDELARQGFAVPQALSDDAKPVVLSGPAQHPVAPPSPPPTEREGVSQTSQEKEKALHEPRTRLCYCGWPARTLQRTPASPVLLVCADFGKAGACKFKDIAGTVEDQGNLDRPMQSEPSPIPTSLKDRLQSERDMLIAALQRYLWVCYSRSAA